MIIDNITFGDAVTILYSKCSAKMAYEISKDLMEYRTIYSNKEVINLLQYDSGFKIEVYDKKILRTVKHYNFSDF